MSPEAAAKYFVGTFTGGERDFLFAHPEFQEALASVPDDPAEVRKLGELGVKLLLTGDYQPPSPWHRLPPDA